MLITRVAFDLLRAPSFRDAAAAYIQRKLDQLRYPAYIGPLKVRITWQLCLIAVATGSGQASLAGICLGRLAQFSLATSRTLDG